MTDITSESKSPFPSRVQLLLAPHRICLVLVWAVVTIVVVTMLFQNVRFTDQYQTIRHLLHSAYAGVLLWYLSRTGSDLKQLPELRPQLFPRWRYGAWIPVLSIVLLLLFAGVSEDGGDLVMLLLIVATAWILIVWYKEINLRVIIQGLSVALIAYLAAIPAVNNGFLEKSTHILLPALSAPMYIAGALLITRTRFGGIQLREGRYARALKSFIMGALLFVPMGLINAADGSPGTDIAWVSEWWMPVSLPWFSGIAEEILFRLFLVGLCFFFLRPAFRVHPVYAMIVAVLGSAVIFGLGHGRSLETLLTTGFLYGLPMAVIFARRDWEHAVGAHYMINMIPWLMLFIGP